jgi:hypothetical protein
MMNFAVSATIKNEVLKITIIPACEQYILELTNSYLYDTNNYKTMGVKRYS